MFPKTANLQTIIKEDSKANATFQFRSLNSSRSKLSPEISHRPGITASPKTTA